MYTQKSDINIQTSTGGDATVYSDVLNGVIRAIKYTKATGTPLASTSDITITTELNGLSVLTLTNINASGVYYPVAPATLPSGAASTLTERGIPVVNERVKAVVAQGGNTKVGTLTVITG